MKQYSDCTVGTLERYMHRKERLWRKKCYRRGLNSIRRLRKKYHNPELYVVCEISAKSRIRVINRTLKYRRKGLKVGEY